MVLVPYSYFCKLEVLLYCLLRYFSFFDAVCIHTRAGAARALRSAWRPFPSDSENVQVHHNTRWLQRMPDGVGLHSRH